MAVTQAGKEYEVLKIIFLCTQTEYIYSISPYPNFPTTSFQLIPSTPSFKMTDSERNLGTELTSYADEWDQLTPLQKHDILFDVSEYVLRCGDTTVSIIPRRIPGRIQMSIRSVHRGTYRRIQAITQGPIREPVYRKFDGFLSKALAVQKFYTDQKSSGSYPIPLGFLIMQNEAAR